MLDVDGVLLKLRIDAKHPGVHRSEAEWLALLTQALAQEYGSKTEALARLKTYATPPADRPTLVKSLTIIVAKTYPHFAGNHTGDGIIILHEDLFNAEPTVATTLELSSYAHELAAHEIPNIGDAADTPEREAKDRANLVTFAQQNDTTPEAVEAFLNQEGRLRRPINITAVTQPSAWSSVKLIRLFEAELQRLRQPLLRSEVQKTAFSYSQDRTPRANYLEALKQLANEREAHRRLLGQALRTLRDLRDGEPLPQTVLEVLDDAGMIQKEKIKILAFELSRIPLGHVVMTDDAHTQPSSLHVVTFNSTDITGHIKHIMTGQGTGAFVTHIPSQDPVLFETFLASAQQADVVIIRHELGGFDGLSAAERLRTEGYNKSIIVFSMGSLHGEEAKRVEAIHATAITSYKKLEELLPAISHNPRPIEGVGQMQALMQGTFPSKTHLRVVDIGTGEGDFLADFQPLLEQAGFTAEFFGTELDPLRVALARDEQGLTGRASRDVRPIDLPGLLQQFGPGSFDLIILNAPTMAIAEQAEILQQLLADGGVIWLRFAAIEEAAVRDKMLRLLSRGMNVQLSPSPIASLPTSGIKKGPLYLLRRDSHTIDSLMAAPVDPRSPIEGAGPVNALIAAGFVDRVAEKSVGIAEALAERVSPDDLERLRADENTSIVQDLTVEGATYHVTLDWEPMAARPGLVLRDVQGPEGHDHFLMGVWEFFPVLNWSKLQVDLNKLQEGLIRADAEARFQEILRGERRADRSMYLDDGPPASTEATVQAIQKVLRTFKTSGLEIILYGSYAENEQRWGSDLDISFTGSLQPHMKDFRKWDQALRAALEAKRFRFDVIAGEPVTLFMGRQLLTVDWVKQARKTGAWFERNRFIWVITANSATKIDLDFQATMTSPRQVFITNGIENASPAEIPPYMEEFVAALGQGLPVAQLPLFKSQRLTGASFWQRELRRGMDLLSYVFQRDSLVQHQLREVDTKLGPQPAAPIAIVAYSAGADLWWEALAQRPTYPVETVIAIDGTRVGHLSRLVNPYVKRIVLIEGTYGWIPRWARLTEERVRVAVGPEVHVTTHRLPFSHLVFDRPTEWQQVVNVCRHELEGMSPPQRTMDSQMSAPVDPRSPIEGAGPVNALIAAGYVDRVAEKSVGVAASLRQVWAAQFSSPEAQEAEERRLQEQSEATHVLSVTVEGRAYRLTLGWEPVTTRPGLAIRLVEGPEGRDQFLMGMWQVNPADPNTWQTWEDVIKRFPFLKKGPAQGFLEARNTLPNRRFASLGQLEAAALKTRGIGPAVWQTMKRDLLRTPVAWMSPQEGKVIVISTHHADKRGFTDLNQAVQEVTRDLPHSMTAPEIIVVNEDTGPGWDLLTPAILQGAIQRDRITPDDTRETWHRLYTSIADERSPVARARRSLRQDLRQVEQGTFPKEWMSDLQKEGAEFDLATAYFVSNLAKQYTLSMVAETYYHPSTQEEQNEQFDAWRLWLEGQYRQGQAVRAFFSGKFEQALQYEYEGDLAQARSSVLRDRLLQRYIRQLRQQHPHATLIILRGFKHREMAQTIQQEFPGATMIEHPRTASSDWRPLSEEASQNPDDFIFDQQRSAEDLIVGILTDQLLTSTVEFFEAYDFVRALTQSLSVEDLKNMSERLNRDAPSGRFSVQQQDRLLWSMLLSGYPGPITEGIKRFFGTLGVSVPSTPPTESAAEIRKQIKEEFTRAAQGAIHRPPADLRKVVALARQLKPDFGRERSEDQLRRATPQLFASVLEESNRVIFLPNHEFYTVTAMDDEARVYQGVILPDSLTADTYLGVPFYSADIRWDIIPSDKVGLTLHHYALVDPLRAYDVALQAHDIITQRPTWYPLTMHALAIWMQDHHIDRVTYARAMGFERSRQEQIQQVKDRIFAERILGQPLERINIDTARAIVKPSSTLGQYQGRRPDNELLSAVILAYAGALGGAIHEMQLYIERGQRDLAYAAFLDYFGTEVVKQRSEGQGARAELTKISAAFFTSGWVEASGARSEGELIQSLTTGPEHPAQRGLNLLKKIYAADFYTDEEQLSLIAEGKGLPQIPRRIGADIVEAVVHRELAGVNDVQHRRNIRAAIQAREEADGFSTERELVDLLRQLKRGDQPSGGTRGESDWIAPTEEKLYTALEELTGRSRAELEHDLAEAKAQSRQYYLALRELQVPLAAGISPDELSVLIEGMEDTPLKTALLRVLPDPFAPWPKKVSPLDWEGPWGRHIQVPITEGASRSEQLKTLVFRKPEQLGVLSHIFDAWAQRPDRASKHLLCVGGGRYAKEPASVASKILEWQASTPSPLPITMTALEADRDVFASLAQVAKGEAEIPVIDALLPDKAIGAESRDAIEALNRQLPEIRRHGLIQPRLGRFQDLDDETIRKTDVVFFNHVGYQNNGIWPFFLRFRPGTVIFVDGLDDLNPLIQELQQAGLTLDALDQAFFVYTIRDTRSCILVKKATPTSHMKLLSRPLQDDGTERLFSWKDARGTVTALTPHEIADNAERLEFVPITLDLSDGVSLELRIDPNHPGKTRSAGEWLSLLSKALAQEYATEAEARTALRQYALRESTRPLTIIVAHTTSHFAGNHVRDGIIILDGEMFQAEAAVAEALELASYAHELQAHELPGIGELGDTPDREEKDRRNLVELAGSAANVIALQTFLNQPGRFAKPITLTMHTTHQLHGKRLPLEHDAGVPEEDEVGHIVQYERYLRAQWGMVEPAFGDQLAGDFWDATTTAIDDGASLSHVRIEGIAGTTHRPLLSRMDDQSWSTVLGNLLRNAFRAMTASSERHLTIETGQDERRDFLRITDTGHGIAPEDLPRIWSSDFSNKPSGIAGSGLGLPIVRRTVLAHGGTIEVTSEVNRGTTFTIRFAHASASPEAPNPGALGETEPTPEPPAVKSGATRNIAPLSLRAQQRLRGLLRKILADRDAEEAANQLMDQLIALSLDRHLSRQEFLPWAKRIAVNLLAPFEQPADVAFRQLSKGTTKALVVRPPISMTEFEQSINARDERGFLLFEADGQQLLLLVPGGSGPFHEGGAIAPLLSFAPVEGHSHPRYTDTEPADEDRENMKDRGQDHFIVVYLAPGVFELTVKWKGESYEQTLHGDDAIQALIALGLVRQTGADHPSNRLTPSLPTNPGPTAPDKTTEPRRDPSVGPEPPGPIVANVTDEDPLTRGLIPREFQTAEDRLHHPRLTAAHSGLPETGGSSADRGPSRVVDPRHTPSEAFIRRSAGVAQAQELLGTAVDEHTLESFQLFMRLHEVMLAREDIERPWKTPVFRSRAISPGAIPSNYHELVALEARLQAELQTRWQHDSSIARTIVQTLHQEMERPMADSVMDWLLHLTESPAHTVDARTLEASYGRESFGYVGSPYGLIRRVMHALSLQPNDVFYDLGSGLGRAVIYAALATPVGQAKGVEIVSERVQQADEAKQALGLTQVDFIQGKAQDQDLSDGTVFFLFSPFTAATGALVNQQLKAVAAQKKIRIVFWPFSHLDDPDSEWYGWYAQADWLRLIDEFEVDRSRAAIFESTLTDEPPATPAKEMSGGRDLPGEGAESPRDPAASRKEIEPSPISPPTEPLPMAAHLEATHPESPQEPAPAGLSSLNIQASAEEIDRRTFLTGVGAAALILNWSTPVEVFGQPSPMIPVDPKDPHVASFRQQLDAFLARTITTMRQRNDPALRAVELFREGARQVYLFRPNPQYPGVGLSNVSTREETTPGDPKPRLAMNLALHMDFFQQLLRNATLDPLSRDLLISVIIKEGATIENIMRNPIGYLNRERLHRQFSSLTFDVNNSIHRDLAKRLTAEFAHGEAVGLIPTLDHWRRQRYSAGRLEHAATAISDPLLRLLLQQFARLLRETDRLSAPERIRFLRIYMATSHVVRLNLPLGKAVTEVLRYEGHIPAGVEPTEKAYEFVNDPQYLSQAQQR